MKQLWIVLLALLSPNIMSAQSITGDWNGLLKVQGMQLRLVFHVSETEGGLLSTMDSPDQGAAGIPVDVTTFEDSIVTFKVNAAGIVYTGQLKNESQIEGTFQQGSNSFPMNLSREAIEKPVINRPQEPKEPLPYMAEEVKFENEKAKVTLAGTLTLPKGEGVFPVAILISGSGPQNRDEEFLTHKPFLVLSDYLTRQGIAVLRYDDRGFGESTGDHNAATSLDFAEDVKAAIAYLKTRKEINQKQIGLIGHSEGGLIAPIVASESKEVAFIVMLAGPGVSGKEISMQQLQAMGKLAGLSEAEIEQEKALTSGVIEIVENQDNEPDVADKLTAYLTERLKDAGDEIQGMDKAEFIKRNVAQTNRPWYAYFIMHQPAVYLKKVKCPVFALNGEKDIQVVPENLAFIEEALKKGENKERKIKEYEGMNHLFQQCETGAMSEYAQIEETISTIVLKDISDWIHELFK